ncbi:type II secretion system F family protein [Oscillochloris sp. ZM17-4]|uniref:type II secretion system F family protein n=1 Tax=Oscillochloris sp. ZM17-4 TaxID=2866714 RepID=UPI001C72F93B|nr:type II secretion system F family protein [Oscillochloris sp. ZM17-4]MBX0327043.1 type II secretion system F family protein [Oscillochloris sp. ZM17-4]
MDSTTIIILGAAALATLTIIVLMIGLRSLTSDANPLASRLETYLSDDVYGMDEAERVADLPSARIAERINESIGQRGFAQQIARQLEQANLPLKVPEWILLRTAIPLLLALGALLIWRDVLVIPPALIVGFIAPVLWLRSLSNRRSTLFGEQLAETLTMICGALRGGFSLAQALTMVAKEAREPTRSELERVTQEVRLGLSLSDALDNLVARLKSTDLELVVTAIKINGRVGGNLTEILESISVTIRERDKLRREVRVITSMQRMSSYVIGGLPFGLAGILFMINPKYMGKLFEPGITLCIPVGAAVSAVIGFLVIQKIADIKV